MDPRAAALAESRLDQVLCGDVFSVLSQLEGQRFDAVVMNDVLEHLADPQELLRALPALLSEGGCLVASIPNVRYFFNVMDLAWHGRWEYTDEGILDRTHLRFFTRSSICLLLEECGFRVETLRGINPTGSLKFKLSNAATLGRFQRHALSAVCFGGATLGRKIGTTCGHRTSSPLMWKSGSTATIIYPRCRPGSGRPRSREWNRAQHCAWTCWTATRSRPPSLFWAGPPTGIPMWSVRSFPAATRSAATAIPTPSSSRCPGKISGPIACAPWKFWPGAGPTMWWASALPVSASPPPVHDYLDVLQEVGFSYDSSIFPVRHPRYGQPGSPRRPFRLGEDPEGLIEIPLSTWRFLGQNVPYSGGGYLRLLPWPAFKTLRGLARRQGVPCITYLHPWELDDFQAQRGAGQGHGRAQHRWAGLHAH